MAPRSSRPICLDAPRRAGADHLRNPDHEAVDAEAPEQILEAQEEDGRAREALRRDSNIAGREVCSGRAPLSSCSLLSSWSHASLCGWSRATTIHTKAHSDRRNAFEDERHLPADAAIRYPVTAAIHVTVTGLPRISIALARERSARVNQLVSRMSIDGKMRLSATPSSAGPRPVASSRE